MKYEEHKTAVKVGVGTLVIAIIAVFANLTQILDWLGIKPHNNSPTESSSISEKITTETEPISFSELTETQTVVPPKEYEPKEVKLTDLDYFNGDNALCVISTKDNLGNTYPSILSTSSGGSVYNDGYSQYYLNKKYSHLFGSAFLQYDSRSSNYETIIEFRGDGIILGTLSFTGGVLPQEFDYNVEDVDVLEIKYHNGMTLIGTEWAFVGIDATLTKADTSSSESETS
ncbi:MAG: hypothetical protein K5695_12285 [Oscillospiraceae bacterium]|nr:hypothetical protein [Oscillospiraceae bacterium]